MRVLETRIVFQTIPGETVEANVAEPDDADGQDQHVVVVPAIENGERWKQVRVSRVVQERADLRVTDVAEHEDIGDKEQQGIDPPMLMSHAK